MKRLKIVDIADNGFGVAKDNGIVYFVYNGVLGEVISVNEENIIKKKNIFYIYDFSVLEESPYLDKSIFEKFSDEQLKNFVNTNGSTLVYLKYDIEKELKKRKIVSAFKKIAKITDSEELDKISLLEVIGDEKDRFYYRNKGTFKVSFSDLGYLRKKTHEFQKVSECILCSKEVNEKLKEKSLNLGEDSNLQEVVIKENELKQRIGDISYLLGEKSFFQINKFNTVKLYDKVVEYVKIIGKKNENSKNKKFRLADIYAGVGSIGIYVKKHVDFISSIYGVEIIKEAVNKANLNAKMNSIPASEFNYVVGDSEDILSEIKFDDIVIVDPPRKGLGKKFTDSLLEKEIENIIYISCDVSTMARDIYNIKSKNSNYMIKEISAVDMFPNTMHVETIVLIQRVKI